MTTQIQIDLPVNARLWLYGMLHQMMTTIAENEKDKGYKIDVQLILEMSLDQIASRRLLPSETLGYDIATVLRTWQEQARDGFTLYEMLKDRVPMEEREVFKDVSHETIHACFITALMLVREAHDQLHTDNAPEELADPLPPPTAPPNDVKPRSLTTVLWPLSVVTAAVLGVCVGVVL